MSLANVKLLVSALLAAACASFALAGGSYGKIAVYSSADPAFQPRVQSALANKQCYCLLHGYTFVLDVFDPPYHGRSPHWNRIMGVYRILAHFDWVLYLDADIFVTNSSISVESILDAAHAEAAASAERWPAVENRTQPFFVYQVRSRDDGVAIPLK